LPPRNQAGIHYFRLAVLAFLAASNFWRLASGSVSGWLQVWSVGVLLLSTAGIVWLVARRRA
jgi:hypothetical protein